MRETIGRLYLHRAPTCQLRRHSSSPSVPFVPFVAMDGGRGKREWTVRRFNGRCAGGERREGRGEREDGQWWVERGQGGRMPQRGQ